MDAERIADTAAGASITLFGLTLANINQIVQIVAGLLAILSGIVAVVYYVSKIRHGNEVMQWKRDEHDGEKHPPEE